MIDCIVLLTPRPCFDLLAPKFMERHPALQLIGVETLDELEALVKQPGALKNHPLCGNDGALKSSSKAAGINLVDTHTADVQTNDSRTLTLDSQIQSAHDPKRDASETQRPNLLRNFSNCRLLSVFSDSVVPKELFDAFGGGFYNVHPGPPSRPGWAPVNYALLDNDTSFGVTLHQAVETVDTGRIIAAEEFPIPLNSNYHELSSMAFEALMRLIDQSIELLLTKGSLQPSAKASEITWGNKRKTKMNLLKDSKVELNISWHELNQKIKAFGMCPDVCRLRVELDGRTYHFEPLRLTRNNQVNFAQEKTDHQKPTYPRFVENDGQVTEISMWGYNFYA